MTAVCVYCASADGIAERHLTLAAEVGRRVAARGWTLVSGGGSKSMMGAVAAAARAGGAHTVGVIPQSMVEREWADHASDELLVVDSMRERKAQMEARADAFLALPGGLGTCEELFEIWTSGYLRLHAKPVVLLDPDGHWTGLLAWVRDLAGQGFVDPAALRRLVVTADVDAALDAASPLFRGRAPAELAGGWQPGMAACGACGAGGVGRYSVIRFGTRTPAQDRALVMAIVNRTPDSFYDRGATFTDAAAMDRVDAAVAEGADIVDIGGVKAGPGADVDLAEEIRRVVPFVAAVRARHPDVVISVDTWRGAVGRAAVAAGADLLNDTWAGADPALGDVAAELGVGIVCSHTGGAVPRRRPHRVRYADVVADVIAEVTGQAERLVARGVPRAGILVDPTHDFGKNTFHGLALLRHCDQLVATGWPVLMALSNKDFIGETLGVTEVTDRLEGTLAATALAAAAGARVFRAHEVAATRRTVDMVASIVGTRPPARTVRALA